ncbi:MAG: hypothetical protein LIO91_03745 [Bacteroidales bacterium]|nr:hypothetical protein [Bacteroidales bacterium]
MTNLEALKAQCKLICNTCYVDVDVLRYSLESAGIYSEGDFTPGDKKLISLAIVIVKGWVETSRSESGISTAIDIATLQNNIAYWCGVAGLDASDYVDGIVSVESGTDLW